MKSLEVKEAQATKSAKEQALEKLAKLEGVIKGLQKKTDDLQEALKEEKSKVAEVIVNQCWWDGKSCGRYSETSGFCDVDGRCLSCSRFDKDRIIFIFHNLLGVDFDYESDTAVEKASEEAEDEAWENINREIDNLGII